MEQRKDPDDPVREHDQMSTEPAEVQAHPKKCLSAAEIAFLDFLADEALAILLRAPPANDNGLG